MTKNENKIENVLQEAIELPKSELGLDYHNNTHYFLCPLFEVKGILKWPNNYLNSYIADNGRKSNIDHPLYCLFKSEDLDGEVISNISRYFQSHPNYAFSYYAGLYGTDNLIMYVLRAKEDQKQDYNYIVSGMYSKTSDSYREGLKKFGFTTPTLSFVNRIINKKPEFKKEMEEFLDVELSKEAELWNKFENHREVFRYVN